MQRGTPTARGPRLAARVGYHMGLGLATTFTWADCRDFGRFCGMRPEKRKNPPGEDPAGLFGSGLEGPDAGHMAQLVSFQAHIRQLGIR